MKRTFLLRCASVVFVGLLQACSKPTDLRVEVPDGATIVVTETRQNLTRTPEGSETVEVSGTKVWIVREAGRLGGDEVSWTEEVTAWEIRREGLAGVYTWNLTSEEPLHESLQPYAPSAARQVWVAPDGVMTARASAAASNEAAEQPVTERRPVDQIPSWLAGLARVPKEPMRPGKNWSWQTDRSVTPAMPATLATTWTFTGVAGGQGILQETIALEGSPPPAAGSFQTTGITGSGDLRLDLEDHFPIRYESAFEATIASVSSRGTASLRSTVAFEVR